MTDPRSGEATAAAKPPSPPKRATGRPAPSATFGAAAAVFLVMLAFLALEVRAGNDPAIGAAKPQAAAQPARPVVVRRVIVRRVVRRHRAAPAVAPSGAAPAGGAAPAAAAASAPAPAASAPAPAPAAPAPAPAPAPVVSQAS